MASRTIPGPVIDESNVVLRNLVLVSVDARAPSVSAYHKVEVGLAVGTNTTWIGTWDQSTQKIEAGVALRILDDDRLGMRIPKDSVMVVRVTSSGSPATIETAKVHVTLGLAGGRAGEVRPLLSVGASIIDHSARAAVQAITRQINSGGLSEWSESIALRDPEDTTYFSPYVLDANNETVTIVSSSTETTVYSVTVPAGTLSGDRAVRVFVQGIFVNNDGAARNWTVAIKYDNTTMWADTVSITNSASTRSWFLYFVIAPTNEATNAQNVSGRIGLSAAGGATTGYGDLAAANGSDIGGTAAEDAATALALTVTMTHGTNSANLSLSKYRGSSEVI